MNDAFQERLSTAATAEPEMLTILLVDDQSSVLRFLASACAKNNSVTATAASAEQALRLVADQQFDLILSDINMPGLNGLEFLRAVKSKQPGTRVALMTGVPSVDSAAVGLRYGAYDYLPKPFSVTELKTLLERVRADRRLGGGRVDLRAGLAEEMERRQLGLEALLHIGELALESADPGVLMDAVLHSAVRAIRCDAALMLLRDAGGEFQVRQHGSASLAVEITRLLQVRFGELIRTGGGRPLALTGLDGRITALVTLVPGIGQAIGMLCLAREASLISAFLPHETELLLGFARTAAVALQKLLLRENVQRNLIDTISSFINALESKDPYLKGHSARVSLYSGEIATVMGMAPAEAEVVNRGGMLHDLGKLGTLDQILRMPRKLTFEEFDVVKGHPAAGDKILKPLRFLAGEAKAVRHHHERYDGRGYPDKLESDGIPLIARIVSVADAFDAMTSDRPYRRALAFEDGLREITRSMRAQFDPAVARALDAIPRARLLEISQSWTINEHAERPVPEPPGLSVEALPFLLEISP